MNLYCLTVMNDTLDPLTVTDIQGRISIPPGETTVIRYEEKRGLPEHLKALLASYYLVVIGTYTIPHHRATPTPEPPPPQYYPTTAKEIAALIEN